MVFTAVVPVCRGELSPSSPRPAADTEAMLLRWRGAQTKFHNSTKYRPTSPRRTETRGVSADKSRWSNGARPACAFPSGRRSYVAGVPDICNPTAFKDPPGLPRSADQFFPFAMAAPPLAGFIAGCILPPFCFFYPSI